MLRDLPEEVQGELFRWAEQREYRSLACCSSSLATLSVQQQARLALDGDSVTCFAYGAHLTAYQTALLRHLLRYGAEARYTCLPDVFNLVTISVLYAALVKKPLIVAVTAVDFVTRFIQSESALAALAASPDFPGISHNRTLNKFRVRVGELELYVDAPYRALDKIHPSFEQVQRYPVWCFNADHASPPVLEHLKCLDIRGYNREIVPVHGAAPSDDEQYTRKDFEENDVFYVSDSNPSNIYAILSQIPSARPKLCVIYNSSFVKMSAAVPLPLAYYRSFPGKLRHDQKLPPLPLTEEVTYAKLLALQNSVLVYRNKFTPKRNWVLIDPSFAANDQLVAAAEPYPVRSRQQILAAMDEAHLTGADINWIRNQCMAYGVPIATGFDPCVKMEALRALFT